MKVAFCFAVCLVCAVMSWGCGIAADQLRTQAVYDMQCPSDQLTFTSLGGRQVGVGDEVTTVQGVSGCGKRSSYTWDARSLAWIKNGADSAVAPQAAPPAIAAPH
jgi:hypothetical protein